MTDPNIPPSERPEVVHNTTINNPSSGSGSGSGGSSWIGFLVGGLLLVVVVIGFIVFSRGGMSMDGKDTNVDVDVDLPAMEAPKMPDLPNMEPPTLPSPGPAPAN